MSNTIEKREERRVLHRDIIELIIYFASNRQKELPGVKRRLLAGIILASCDYLTQGEDIYLHCGNDRSWEEKVTRRLPCIIDDFGDDLHRDIKDMLLNISQFRDKSGSKFRYENAFYDLFSLYVGSNDYPIVQLSEKFKERIESEVLEKFSSKLVSQCKKIGKLMANHIEKEVEELKKTPK